VSLQPFGRRSSPISDTFPATHGGSVPTMATPDTNSSDAVLRAYAPAFLADSYKALSSPAFDDEQRIRNAWMFVESALAYLAGILATEHAGLALPRSAALRDLMAALERPALGHWVTACDRLARELVKHRDALVAPEIPGVFRTADDRPTAARGALEAIVGVRNRWAHPREAIHALAEIQQPLRVFTDALRVLRRYPLCWVRDHAQTRDGRVTGTVLRFGADVATVPFSEETFSVPTREAFVVGATGDVLVLAPWVVVEPYRLVPMLVAGAKGDDLLYPPGGGARRVDELLAPPSQARRRGAMSATCARSLADREFGTPRLAGFHIERKLGEGASGAVWLAAHDTSPSTKVAVKVLHPALATIDSQKRRLRAEHDLLTRLDHPNIVQVRYLGDDPDVGLYVVMEWFDGTDLGTLVEPGGLSPDVAVAVMRKVLDALAAAHRVGIVHRDVKPSNVLVAESGEVRLIDFGIGWADDRSFRTGTFEVVGTAAFAAPEQLRGEAIDARSDVFGAGRLLEFLLEGPGVAGTPKGTVPDALRAVIRRATQDNPAHRFASAEEMRRALEPDAVLPSPVRPGDRLDGYLVRAVQGSGGGAFWMLLASEVTSNEQVGLLVASDDTARSTLTRGVSALPEPQRRAIGYRGLFETKDRMMFAVVRPGDGPARLLSTLGPRPAATTDAMATAAVVGTAAAAVAAAGIVGAAAGLAVTGGVFANIGLLAKRRRAALEKKKL
jgi:hypothetical protein